MELPANPQMPVMRMRITPPSSYLVSPASASLGGFRSLCSGQVDRILTIVERPNVLAIQPSRDKYSRQRFFFGEYSRQWRKYASHNHVGSAMGMEAEPRIVLEMAI